LLPEEMKAQAVLGAGELGRQGRVQAAEATGASRERAAGIGDITGMYKESMATPNVLPAEQKQMLENALRQALQRMGINPAAGQPGGLPAGQVR
jgi:hypothetical protein